MNRKEKILVLDNERNWLITIRNLLSDKYNLILTTSVAQAKRHAKDGSIVMAILDQRLSNRQKGIRILGDLRKNLPDLRAIILTEFPNEDDHEHSYQAGALDYVSKREKHLKEHLIKSIERNKKANHVFLAYQNNDEERVEALYHQLTAKGFFPWMDKKSALNGEWEPQIKRAIEESDFFLACFSRGSLRKKRSMFRKELKLALELQEGLFESEVFIIPIRLGDCEIPVEFGRFESQRIHLREKDALAKLISMFG